MELKLSTQRDRMIIQSRLCCAHCSLLIPFRHLVLNIICLFHHKEVFLTKGLKVIIDDLYCNVYRDFTFRDYGCAIHNAGEQSGHAIKNDLIRQHCRNYSQLKKSYESFRFAKEFL